MSRLIDADALLESFKNADCGYGFNDTGVKDIITNAPTVQREGWVSVPIELNRKQKQAMIWAYEEAMGGARLPDGDAYDETVVQKMHEAMLSAAPKE